MSTWTSAISMISESLRSVTGTHSPDRSRTICSVASDFSLVYGIGLFGGMTSSFETRPGAAPHRITRAAALVLASGYEYQGYRGLVKIGG